MLASKYASIFLVIHDVSCTIINLANSFDMRWEIIEAAARVRVQSLETSNCL